MPSIPTPSKSGIIETQTGERHIPSSVRPDGTQRKEIKVRPGYRPPEDVEVYKNRTADAWKTRGSGRIPGAAGLQDDKEDSTAAAAGSNKNAKRREARRKAKAAEETGEGKVASKGLDGVNGTEKFAEEEKATELEVDPEVEKEKRARNLRKKLKQARDLKEKKEGGGVLLPEQFAKVIKINELIRELDALGFDSEGDPKGKEEPKGN